MTNIEKESIAEQLTGYLHSGNKAGLAPTTVRRERQHGQFYIDAAFKELQQTFNAKQEEYKGKSDDVFRNFNQGGVLQNETPEQTLLGYVDKQIVSLFDAKHTNPERLSDIGFVHEKAKDIAVYMVILMAMVSSKGGDN